MADGYFDSLRAVLLRWLRVPPEPKPPSGSPESVRVFRAARNFYRLLVAKWWLKQISVAIGAAVGLAVWDHFTARWGPTARAVFAVLEVMGLAGYVAQLPFTYLALRLEYEVRWYIVTDRSVRIRTGIWTLREMTLTFANIQQTTIRQGPLQRLLGIADLQITTAGGGGGGGGHGASEAAGDEDAMHTGFFHGVDNAAEIRDLIRERMRRLRDTGLGDPDDVVAAAPTAGPSESPVLEAARQLLAEVREWRAGLPGCSETQRG